MRLVMVAGLAVAMAGVGAAGPTSAAGPISAAGPTLAAADVGAARMAAANLLDSAELTAFKKAIRAKYALKERAFANHDADTIVRQFYTPDVISVGQGEGIYVGSEQIRPLYAEVVKTNKVRIDSIYTFVKGDAGWDWADFHVYPTDGKTAPFTFAILFLWTKIDGEWMCKGDFFVTGSLKDGKLAPPPGPPTK